MNAILLSLLILTITYVDSALACKQLCGVKAVFEVVGNKAILTLPNDVQIHGKLLEHFGTFSTYSHISVSVGGKTMYKDTLNEFEFKPSKFYPCANLLVDGSVEIFLEINDHPSKTKVLRLVVLAGRLIKNELIPCFDYGPKDYDKDGIIEFGGFFDYSEPIGRNSDSIRYNPILFYEKTDGGIKLDTSLTIRECKRNFGFFQGYSYQPKVKLVPKREWSKLKILY